MSLNSLHFKNNDLFLQLYSFIEQLCIREEKSYVIKYDLPPHTHTHFKFTCTLIFHVSVKTHNSFSLSFASEKLSLFMKRDTLIATARSLGKKTFEKKGLSRVWTFHVCKKIHYERRPNILSKSYFQAK